MDPRIAVALVLLYAGGVAVARSPWSLLLGLAIAIVLVAVRWRLAGKVAGRLVWLNLALVPIWFFVPLDFVGPAWWQWTWSSSGMGLATVVTLRANAIGMVAAVVAESVGVTGVLQALRAYRLPEKLVSAVGLCWRYLSLSGEEFTRLRSAMLARGYAPSATWRGYSTIASALGILILRGLDRSDRVARAMAARRIGTFHSPAQVPLTPRDWWSLGIGASLIACLFVVEWIDRPLS